MHDSVLQINGKPYRHTHICRTQLLEKNRAATLDKLLVAEKGASCKEERVRESPMLPMIMIAVLMGRVM